MALKRRKRRPANYCGCCGRERTTLIRDSWCEQCWQEHVDRSTWRPAWEKTYFAQHGKPCPYDECQDPW